MTENCVESSGQDVVAVVGLSCRLPGADSPEAYWDLLAAGREAVGEVPADRIAHVGVRVGRAGLIDGVADFDAGFFGVSPREAAAMDPRQRLMLELAWEALERAGVDPSAARGNQAGVFIGAMGDDYAGVVHDQGEEALDSFTLAALQRGMLANRISFFEDCPAQVWSWIRRSPRLWSPCTRRTRACAAGSRRGRWRAG